MNHFVLSGIVLSALIAAAFCEICTPSQWKVDQFGSGGYTIAGKLFYGMERTKYFYDAVNQRVAFDFKLFESIYTTEGRIVITYDKTGAGRIYIADMTKNACVTTVVKEPFQKVCVPDNFKSEDIYFGLKGEGFQVTRYHYQINDWNYYTVMRRSGKGDAIPIFMNFHKRGGVEAMQTNTFENMDLNVKDSDFSIPVQCLQKQDTSAMLMEIVRGRNSSSTIMARMLQFTTMLGY